MKKAVRKKQKRVLNHNKVDNQYEKNLEILKERIKNIERNTNISENNKKKYLSNEFRSFISGNLPKKKELAYLIDIISETIKNNSKFAFEIISSFTQGCISAENDLTKIGANISKIINTDKIKGNPDLVFNIINGFV